MDDESVTAYTYRPAIFVVSDSVVVSSKVPAVDIL